MSLEPVIPRLGLLLDLLAHCVGQEHIIGAKERPRVGLRNVRGGRVHAEDEEERRQCRALMHADADGERR